MQGYHNLVQKFFLVLQEMKFLDAKAAVDKEWEKREKLPARQLNKVKGKELTVRKVTITTTFSE